MMESPGTLLYLFGLIILNAAFEFPDNLSVAETRPMNEFSAAIVKLGLSCMRSPTLSTKFYSENVIFSPMSVAFCVGMVYVGSASETKAEIRRSVFDMDEDVLLRQAKDFLSSVKSMTSVSSNATESHMLRLVNAVLVQQNMNISVKYSAKVKDKFAADIYGVDFFKNPDHAAKLINEWVDSSTNGKIKNILAPGTLTSLTRLILLNAIYFNGNWQSQFKEQKNANMTFNVAAGHGDLGGSPPFVTMMKQTGVNFLYAYNAQHRIAVLGLPYLDLDLVFYVFLPDDSSSLQEFEKSLTGDLFKDLIISCKKSKVEVTIPKFSMKTNLDLKRLLVELGVKKLFQSGEADLEPIDGTRTLYASDARHSAFIQVNEKGSESAAASSLAISFRSAVQEEKLLKFTADRPFLYAIVEKSTVSVLFLGRFVKPASADPG